MNLFADKYIRALCWTLVHSLWQGLALALVAGIIIMLTKRSGTVVRYNLLTTLLFLFIAGSLITFYVEWSTLESTTNHATVSFRITQTDSPSPLTSPDIIPAQSSFTNSVISFLNQNSTIIVFIWILIVGFKCLRLFGEIGNLYKIRRRQVLDAGDYWNKRVKELADKLYINRSVQLLQSGLVKVPVVIGHLKPVILLPIGVLNSLPPDEIEAVLLHELAHIRRRDYLVNMLQNLCELIFFFNPFVQWLSAMIRDERENCCDDIAIHEVKNKKKFINALITFQEYEVPAFQYAPRFAGRKMHLLNRVKRIITNNNQTLNSMEKTLLATGIVIAGIVTFAYSAPTSGTAMKKQLYLAGNEKQATITDNTHLSEKGNRSEPKVKVPSTALKNIKASIADSRSNLADTVPDDKKHRNNSFHVTTTKQGKQFEIYVRNGEIIALYVDDQKIPESRFNEYKEIVDNIIKETEEQSEKARDQARQAREEAEVARREAHEVREQAEMARREADRAREQAERQAEMGRREADRAREQAEMGRREADRAREQADRARERAEESRERAEESRTRSNEKRKEAEVRFKNITSDLMSDGLLKDDKDFSFSLDANELIVNGKKQPAEVHAKYKDKYITDPGNKISYSRSKNSTHASETRHSED